MPIRAVWHTDELVLDDEDPFAGRIEDVGTPIVLGAEGEEARLQLELVSTLRNEAQLEAEGTRCKIKQAHDSSCYACPLYQDDDSLMGQLCSIGRRQERLCTRLIVIRNGGRRE